MSSSQDRPRPKKKWGQNFLRNPSAVKKIAAAVEPAPGELILEIGPGEGVLTRELAAAYPNRLRVIEIDPELADRLEQSPPRGDFELIRGDATVVPLPDEPFVAVGNLPYNDGNPIIRRVIAHPQFSRAVFMVQKEVAERLTAHPRDEAYGFFTLAVQLFARTKSILTLEPGSFHPPPKVRSAVVLFERHDTGVSSSPRVLLAVMSAAFHMRRKKLVNNLATDVLGKEAIRTALQRAGLSADARAEELTLADFDRLTSAIEPDALARYVARPEEHR
jgi:16S rRNA (adenine1518-N6/adenine1519-N6)-dimethyltransferase